MSYIGKVFRQAHMKSATTSQALAAARQWLRPAIYVLLRCGVPWREFAELAKSVYVEIASERFGKRGRPTNVSRTAMLTGLPRRENPFGDHLADGHGRGGGR